ncbi:MAG: hypothetical protein QM496_05680 [Verrucomicrobiota bacterium]
MKLLIVVLLLVGIGWGVKNRLSSGRGLFGAIGASMDARAESENDSEKEKTGLDDEQEKAPQPLMVEKPLLPSPAPVSDPSEKSEQVVIVRKFVNRAVPNIEFFRQNSGTNTRIDWMINPVGNQVIVRLDEDQAPMIEAMLGAIDIAGDQYRVEAVIGFANISNGEKFSLDWVLKYSEGDRLSFDNHSILSSPGRLDLKTDWLTLAIDRLQDSGRLDVVARPSIILSSGETGKISSGREIAVPISDQQGNGNVRNSIEFRRVALTLTVDLVQLGSGVEINVNQISEDVAGETEIDGNLIPEIASQVWESRFRPVLGKWYAVGGLKGQEVRKFKQKGLFGIGFKKDESNARREIALLLRVVPAIAESVSPALATFDPMQLPVEPVKPRKKLFSRFKLPFSSSKKTLKKSFLSSRRHK